MTPSQIDLILNLTLVRANQDAYFSLNGRYHYVPPTAQLLNPTITTRSDGYDGPYGKGYVVIVRSPDYQKAVNFGPETDRNLPWTTIEDEE